MSFIIDTAINGQGDNQGRAYFFKDSQSIRYDWNSERVDEGYPADLSLWNLPAPFQIGLHAALNGAGNYAGKAFFFRGDQYVRYDWATDQIDEGYPLPLSAWNLPEPFLSGIDAAINGYGLYEGKAYFFKEGQYVRYDWAEEQIDLQSPLSPWQLPSPSGWRVDAVLAGQRQYVGKAYFFRHGTYVRYDW